MPHRIYSPLAGLLQAWPQKLAASAAGAFLLELAGHVVGLYGRMLEADPLLVFAVFNLLVVDLVTGVAAAKKRGQSVHSRALRRTGWKALEYSAIGFVGIALANAFSGSALHLLTDGLDDAALLYVAITEAFSIAENITGSREGARRLLKRITDLATGRTREVEEVVQEVELRPEEPPARTASGPPDAP